jgi:hypothetical protein
MENGKWHRPAFAEPVKVWELTLAGSVSGGYFTGHGEKGVYFSVSRGMPIFAGAGIAWGPPTY